MRRLILPFLFLVSLKLALQSSQKTYTGNTATASVSGLGSATIVYNRSQGTIRFPATLFGLAANTPTPVAGFSMPSENQNQVDVSSLDFSGSTIPGFSLTRSGNQYSGTVFVNSTNRILTVTDLNDTDSDGIPDLSDLVVSQKPSFPFPPDYTYILRATHRVTLSWQVTATNAHGYSFTNLPPGLTGHGSGLLEGAPDQTGLYRATVTATNFSGTSKRDLDIFVLPSATNLPLSDDFSADDAPNRYLMVPAGAGSLSPANSRLTFFSAADTNAATRGNFVKAVPNLQLSLSSDWEAEAEVALPSQTSVYEAVGLGLFPEDPSGDLASVPDWFSLELGQEFGVQRVWAYVRQKKTAHGSMESTLAESLDSPTRANLRLQYRAADKILVSSYRSLPSGPWVTLLTNTLNYYDYGPNSIGYRWDMTNLAATTLRVALWADSYESNAVTAGSRWLDGFSVRPGSPPSAAPAPPASNHPVGTTLTLSAGAHTSGPCTYQWQFHGTNLPGATASTLLLFSPQASNSGAYSVVLSNLYGSVTSPVANLNFLAPPVISQPPEFYSRPAGESLALSVAASGDAPLTYQWRFNGADLAGATNATLTLSNLVPAQAGPYSVVVANLVGSATQDVALVSVTRPLPFADSFASNTAGWLFSGGTSRPFITNGVLAPGTSAFLSSARPPVSLSLTSLWVAEVDAVLAPGAADGSHLTLSLYPEEREIPDGSAPTHRLDLRFATGPETNRQLQLVLFAGTNSPVLLRPSEVLPQPAIRLRLALLSPSGPLYLAYRSSAEALWTPLANHPIPAGWTNSPHPNLRLSLSGSNP